MTFPYPPEPAATAANPFVKLADMQSATTKATPVDADGVILIDSAASNAIKRTLWSAVKATLKTYFDTLYFGTSFTKAQLDAAVSDDNVAYLGQSQTFIGNQAVTGNLGISGLLQIGSGQTPFGAISIQQSTSGSGYPSGWHAVEDFSVIQPASGSTGYASFDARPTITANMGHAVGFQSRPTVNGTLTDRLSAIDASPVFNTGTTPLVHGLLINDVTGTGVVTTDYGIRVVSTLKGSVNNYGIHIGPVQNGSGVNWGIYCESKSRFLSSITVSASSPSSWSPVNLGAANANVGNRISVYENPGDGTFFRGIAMVNPGIYGLGLYGGTDSSLPTNSNADVVIATGGNVLMGSNTDNGSKLQVTGAITASGSIKVGIKTIATLPSAASSTGERYQLSDSATIVNRVAFSNGTAWYYEGTAVAV